MLEINRRPVNDLKHLIELIGQRRVERELNVHRTTVKRWLLGQVRIPGAQHLAIKGLLGDLPGTVGRWTGWRFEAGGLVSPGGDTFTAGDVLSLGLLRQQLAQQRREILELRAKVKALETSVDALSPAANDSRAVG